MRCLLSGCRALAAGVLADVSSEVEAALETFGHDIGIAFQLIDDLLDYAADPDQLGKQIGADLREGKMTYPLIHLLEHGSEQERGVAMRSLGNAEETRECLDQVVAAMRRVGSFDARVRTIRLGSASALATVSSDSALSAAVAASAVVAAPRTSALG